MIRVILVDQHALIRAGVRLILENADGINVVGESEWLDEALRLIARKKPDLVLMNMEMTVGSESKVITAIRDACPACQVLLLTGDIEVEKHKTAMRAGARGVFLTHRKPEVLISAVKKVCDGELWINRSLTAELLAGLSHRPEQHENEKIASLTARELEVVRLIAKGLTNKDVASRLSITEKTVRNHLTVVYSKLELSSRLELAVYSHAQGVN